MLAASFALLAGCSDTIASEDEGGEVDTVEVNIEEGEGMFTMLKGDTFQLKITTSPSENAKLSFFYTREGVVEVDENHRLKAVGIGTCALSIMAHKGETAAFRDIVVYVESLIESVDIAEGYEAVAINVGQTFDITPYYTLQPAGYIRDAEKYTMESDNTSVATVDPETGIISAVAAGTTKVHIKSTDGSGAVSSIEVMVTADGGYNMSPLSTAGWKASASSQSSGYPAANILDGTTTTVWRSASSAASPQWVLVDMGKETTFDRIDVLRAANYAKEVEIWISKKDSADLAADDDSFERIGAVNFEQSVSNAANNIRVKSFYPESHTARYIKLVVTGTHYNYYHSLAKMDVIRRK